MDEIPDNTMDMNDGGSSGDVGVGGGDIINEKIADIAGNGGDDDDILHHSYFIMISLFVLVIAGGLGVLMVKAQQAQIQEKKNK